FAIRRLQRGDLARNVEGGQATERIDQLVREPPPDTAERQRLHREKRRQATLGLAAQKFLQATAYLLARLALDKIPGARFRPRRQHLLARRHTADDLAAPT